MNQPILKVKGISKTYGSGETSVHALHGVDLTLGQKEFVVIMGASGSGKSTFLHIVGGLEQPSGGRLFVEGDEIRNFSLEPVATKYRREKLGFVFQFFNLLSSLTAEENVGLPLLLQNEKKPEVKQRAQEMLRIVGLYERRDHYPHQLSGGQQQRVAIARALIHQPPVLLADEPTGNLDSKTSAEMLELFIKMRDEMGQSILLVTHDPMVASYADRVVFFKDGRIVEQVSPDSSQSLKERTFMIMDQLRAVMEV